jgi:hypothetical protein
MCGSSTRLAPRSPLCSCGIGRLQAAVAKGSGAKLWTGRRLLGQQSSAVCCAGLIIKLFVPVMDQKNAVHDLHPYWFNTL